VKAALIQMHGDAQKERNVERAEALVRQAADQGAQVVCLQELFNTIYFCFENDPTYFELAEPIPGPSVDRMAELAGDLGVVIVAPIYELGPDGERYNTAAVLGPTGDLLGIYRKSGIAAIETPTLSGDEPYYFKPGDTGFEVFETPFARIGILICYDRHFPEAARILALRGAQVVFVPNATSGMSRDLWTLELRAHAVENVYYVGGVNRVGYDVDGSPNYFYGSSFFCDPTGRIIVQAGDENEEVVTADLDFSVIEPRREEWGFFRHRRPDLYTDLVK